MKILSLDSTSFVASAAICDSGKVIASMTETGDAKHSEILLPMIEKMLRENNIRVSDIDLFACSKGPGSFTGVRIGASLIKGLAYGEKKCVGVSTLEALAYNMISENGIVSPVMDARRDQVYNAIFRIKDGKVERLTEDRVISIEALENELSLYKEKIYLTGDGYFLAKSKINNKFIEDTCEDKIYENAVSVALLAEKIYEKEGAVSDIDLVPTYLRLPQAERERNERLGK